MNKLLQISSYAVSFVLVFAIGNVLGGLFFWAGVYYNDAMPGSQLPNVCLFFSKNHLVITYFFLFPWLFFVGLPALPSNRVSYWDTQSFLLRFSVFIPTEIILLCFFSYAYCLPFIPRTGRLYKEGELPSLSWIDISMRGLFWLSVLLLVTALLMRVWRSRNSNT